MRGAAGNAREREREREYVWQIKGEGRYVLVLVAAAKNAANRSNEYGVCSLSVSLSLFLNDYGVTQ